MSKPRGKSSEASSFKPSQIIRSPISGSYKTSLKSKISEVLFTQLEQKLKTLKLIRNNKSKLEASNCSSDKIKFLKTMKDRIGQLSTSINTENSCLDLSSIDCQEFLKSSDSYRKLKIDLKTVEEAEPVSLGMTLKSPLCKIPEIDQDLEKTPAFKVNPNILRNRKNAGGSSNKKRRPGSVKKPLKAQKEITPNKEHLKVSPNNKHQSEQTEENFLGILANQEKIFNTKISELCIENERKIRTLEEKILGLKKENQRLVCLVGDKNSTVDAKKRGISNSDYIKDYDRLLTANEEKKSSKFTHDKENSENLCTKCKAFVNTNSELKTKICRLREYINSDS